MFILAINKQNLLQKNLVTTLILFGDVSRGWRSCEDSRSQTILCNVTITITITITSDLVLFETDVVVHLRITS